MRQERMCLCIRIIQGGQGRRKERGKINLEGQGACGRKIQEVRWKKFEMQEGQDTCREKMQVLETLTHYACA